MQIRLMGNKNCKCIRFLKHKLKRRLKDLKFADDVRVQLTIFCETADWVYFRVRILCDAGGWKGSGAYDKIFDEIELDELTQYYEQFGFTFT